MPPGEQHLRIADDLAVDTATVRRLPALAPTWTRLASRSSVSPGLTTLLNLTRSNPPKTGRCSSWLFARYATPDVWAKASTMRTPGTMGCDGKWPRKNSSSPERCHRQRATAWLQLDHLVDEQEWGSVREQVLWTDRGRTRRAHCVRAAVGDVRPRWHGSPRRRERSRPWSMGTSH